MNNNWCDQLHHKLSQRFTREDYGQAGLLPTGERVSGRSFFPGGNGVWNGLESSMKECVPGVHPPPVMVIGNNLDSEESYTETVYQGFEGSSGTWTGLKRIIESVGLPFSKCFFTNSIMGVIPGNKPTGQSPGARCPAFLRKCDSFLSEQILTVRPRLVIALGEYAVVRVACVAKGLERLRTWNSFKWVDQAQLSVVDGVGIEGEEDLRFAFVVAIHPSYPVNVRLRSFAGHVGRKAEEAIWREGLMRAKIDVAHG